MAPLPSFIKDQTDDTFFIGDYFKKFDPARVTRREEINAFIASSGVRKPMEVKPSLSKNACILRTCFNLSLVFAELTVFWMVLTPLHRNAGMN
jgi:hypothetical protein